MTFADRHIGPDSIALSRMLSTLGVDSLDTLSEEVVPAALLRKAPLSLPEALSETDAHKELRSLASQNRLWRSLIGQGYYGTVTPPTVLRTVFENPAWYSAYTPYQPEISQGRLEALLNWQTLVSSLTGLPIANASLLDEATAAAEAASLCQAAVKGNRSTLWVSDRCHPQTLAVVRQRAEPLGWKVIVSRWQEFRPDADTFAVLVQYPDTLGHIDRFESLAKSVHDAGALFIAASDLLALTLLRSPASFGADVSIGSAQRFGVPMGFGGPHAAFIAVRDDLKRLLPGRLVGVARDAHGEPALRLSLQTREQHIRREKATSNICTAQVLLAVMASFYAIWHGPHGLARIAHRVHRLTLELAYFLRNNGLSLASGCFFDTLTLNTSPEAQRQIRSRAEGAEINLRYHADGRVSLSLDERTDEAEVLMLMQVICGGDTVAEDASEPDCLPAGLLRTDAILTQEVFNRYHTETELMRYIRRLESKDLTLANAMIPLGSCTMKLNAASELMPVSWTAFSDMHPLVPEEQARGFHRMIADLEGWLCEITGFAGVSLQPNSGAAGEYAGLLAIRTWHSRQGTSHRNICLIPESAHGTNPASAVMAGYKVVAVKCINGGIDRADLEAKAHAHADTLAALMITYPSTYGVFEADIRQVCDLIHRLGGQVYLDGANMNAMVGLCRPGDIGADVCHLNLHKTFCIPHGGGGPGVGPIGVARHLVDCLPGDPCGDGRGAVSAARFGSASILPIPWMYIRMMGAASLRRATQVAILNANYIVHRLRGHYPLLFSGNGGRVAHEGILDLRPFKKTCGIEAEDVAKRLMDYGFHAPTLSWPVAGTLMIEPTESESLSELDRFCEAMIAIRKEIAEIEEGRASVTDNVLKNAPHTVRHVTDDAWKHGYTRQQAAWPKALPQAYKFWPSTGRIDSVYGDRNLVCTCPSVSEIAQSSQTT